MKKILSLAVFVILAIAVFKMCSGSDEPVPDYNIDAPNYNVEASTDGTDTKAKDTMDNSKTINGHKFVDLGLPSGLLWAETNVGAETENDFGDYFAWGETEPKKTYTYESGKYSTSETNMTKYNKTDGLTVLEADDDAAHVNWGAPCRMPTETECQELMDYDLCSWTYEIRTSASGADVVGYKVTSNKNGNSIFMPFSGYYSGENLLGEEQGLYYCSTLFEDNWTSGFSLKSDQPWWTSITRCLGCTIRPVAEP